jgi:hypothetical protein
MKRFIGLSILALFVPALAMAGSITSVPGISPLPNSVGSVDHETLSMSGAQLLPFVAMGPPPKCDPNGEHCLNPVPHGEQLSLGKVEGAPVAFGRPVVRNV